MRIRRYRDMRGQSHTRDPIDHPRRSPSGKQTIVSRLDKVIGIPVRVLTPDTRHGSEYTFAKTSAPTTFTYCYYQLQYLN